LKHSSRNNWGAPLLTLFEKACLSDSRRVACDAAATSHGYGCQQGTSQKQEAGFSRQVPSEIFHHIIQ
jgi:hypothetical protein